MGVDSRPGNSFQLGIQIQEATRQFRALPKQEKARLVAMGHLVPLMEDMATILPDKYEHRRVIAKSTGVALVYSELRMSSGLRDLREVEAVVLPNEIVFPGDCDDVQTTSFRMGVDQLYDNADSVVDMVLGRMNKHPRLLTSVEAHRGDKILLGVPKESYPRRLLQAAIREDSRWGRRRYWPKLPTASGLVVSEPQPVKQKGTAPAQEFRSAAAD